VAQAIPLCGWPLINSVGTPPCRLTSATVRLTERWPDGLLGPRRQGAHNDDHAGENRFRIHAGNLMDQKGAKFFGGRLTRS